MENRRSKAFLVILTVLLCLSVCVGLTYAYFTDSAKSSGNKIQAGNLKLDLKLYDKVDDEWISIKNTEDPVFNYDKWEPGYVDAKLLKIENLGDLAMQWEAKLVSTEAVSAFANAIEVYVQKSDAEIAYPADRAAALAWTKVGTLDQFINTTEKLASGTFTAQGEAYYIGIAFYMPAEITDNTLQGQVLGAFDIQINATQLPYESDAFDENYDDITIDSNGGVTPPGETESESDTTTSSSEPEPTDTSSNEPTDEPEPTDPEMFTWELNDDGNSYTVTGFKDDVTPPADLVIPSTYNGGAVTGIGANAFQWCNMTSVTIPEGVTTIGDYAFYSCDSLQNISIPNSITYIGSEAFYDCYNLEYNEDDDAYYLGNDSNPYVVLISVKDTSITSFDFNENTKIIYHNAFEYCYSLSGELAIPNGVTQIGNYAFYECSGLTNIEIPDSVTTIGNSAFCGCSGLTSIEIPDSVTTIGDSAFSWCSNLTSVTIPDSVTTISNGAFSSCSNLTSVTIPDSVTIIGSNAFSNCSGLTGELIIPDSVTTIGDWAFVSCSGLTSIEIPDSVTTIGSYAFSYCSALTGIEIPDSVTTIGNNAFHCCSGLTSITVAEGNPTYYSIDNCLIERETNTLLRGCKNSVIPYGVTTIDGAFTGCSDLTSIEIPDSVTTIGDYAFYTCFGLTSIVIPDGVTTIGNNAFCYCESLTSVMIPDSVTTISDDAFRYCYNLTSVTIGNSVTTISKSAFYECTSLTEITIPDSVITIDETAFGHCFNLTSVTIGSNTTTIDYSAFYRCSSLARITVALENATYYCADNCLIERESNKLLLGCKNSIIPNNITTIGFYAFSGCSGLTSIDIPNSVTTIEGYAFYDCSRLTSITFDGTIAQWKSISKEGYWDYSTGEYTIYCTDGTIAKDGTATYN